MRRLPSWLIVVAVGILVALAAADAIRPKTEEAPRSATTTNPLGLRGVLVVAGPDCSVAAFRLPGLTEQQPPRQPNCGGRIWSQDGTLAAHCTKDNGTEIFTSGLEFTARVAGCASSWRPDGALTLIRDGDIVLWRRRGRVQTLVRGASLGSDLRVVVQRPETYRFAGVCWLDDSTYAAIVKGKRPWETAVVIFDDLGPRQFVPALGAHPEDLHASPRGFIAFARTNPVREYTMVSRGGEEVAVPRIANAHALAWSPDDRWVAIATRTTTFIAHVGSRQVVKQVPVGGDSLAWFP
jgi:hypothetical protein